MNDHDAIQVELKRRLKEAQHERDHWQAEVNRIESAIYDLDHEPNREMWNSLLAELADEMNNR